MATSAGNADKEMKVIEQSIDYKINALKQTWVGFGQDMIDRGVVGGIVDALTSMSKVLTEIISKAGFLKSVLMGVFGFMGAKDALHVNSNGGILSSFMTGLIGTNGGSVIGDFRGNRANKNFNNLVRNALYNGWTIDVDSDDYKHVNSAFKDAYKDLEEGLKSATANKDELWAGYIAQTEKAGKVTSKFATIARSAGAMLTNMGIAFLIGTAINFGKAILSANKNLKQLQETAKTATSESQKTFASYKDTIKEQADILRNEASSHEQVISAKEKLSAIQDEINEKYGNYGESGQVIQDITNLINGQTDAVDKLSNSLNSLSNADFGKIMRDLNKGEGLSRSDKIGLWIKKLFQGDLFESNAEILFDRMNDLSQYTARASSNDVTEISNAGLLDFDYGRRDASLFEIIDYVNNNKKEYEEFLKTDAYQNLKDYYDVNKDFYDQYVLNEKVLKDYESQYERLMNISSQYEKGDSKDNKLASFLSYKDLINELEDSGAEDYIVSYFKRQNEQLTKELTNDQLESDIKNRSELFAQLINDIKYAYKDASAEEDIRFFNEKYTGNTEAQIKAYKELKDVAFDYGLTIGDVIDKLIEMGKITSYGVNGAFRDLNSIISGNNLRVDNISDLLKGEDEKARNEENKKIIKEDIESYKREREEATAELNELVNEYKDVFTNLGYSDLEKAKQDIIDGLFDFGNINTNTRGIIKLTEENISEYEEALKSHGMSDLVGSVKEGWSSVISDLGSAEYNEELGWNVAFSPLLQMGDGKQPKLLDSDTVNEYISQILNKANEDGVITKEEILELDLTLKPTINGVENISGLIAGASQDKNEISLLQRLMHYSGATGVFGIDDDGINKKQKELNEINNYRSLEESSNSYLKSMSNITKGIEKANKERDEEVESINANKDSYKDAGKEIRKAESTHKNLTKELKASVWKKQEKLVNDYNKQLDALGDDTSAVAKQQRAELIKLRDTLLSVGDGIIGLNDFKLDFSTEKEKIQGVTTALSEMNSVGGLSADSISAITSAFSGLPSWDKSKVFEVTADGVVLNRKELEKLNAEYAKNNSDAINTQLENLSQKYAQVADKISHYTSQQEIANALSEADSIKSQIQDLELLKAQYDGLTSSYQKWQDALSSTNNNDMFKNEGDQYEAMKKYVDNGWWGNDDLQAYLDLMLGERWRNPKNFKNAKEAFDSLTTKKIDGTDHTLMDYFTYTTDDSGNKQSDMTSKGLDYFMQDIQKLANDGKLNKIWDGEKFNFGVVEYDESLGRYTTGLDVLADTFGTTTEEMEIFFKALQEKGEDVEFTSIYDTNDVFKNAEEEIEKKRAELQEMIKTQGLNGDETNILEDIGLKVDVDPIDLDNSIKEYKDKLKELKEELDKATKENDLDTQAELNLKISAVEYELYDQINSQQIIKNNQSVLPRLNTNEATDQGNGLIEKINNIKTAVDSSDEILKRIQTGDVSTIDDTLMNGLTDSINGLRELTKNQYLNDNFKEALDNAVKAKYEENGYNTDNIDFDVLQKTVSNILDVGLNGLGDLTEDELTQIGILTDVLRESGSYEGFDEVLSDAGFNDDFIKNLLGDTELNSIKDSAEQSAESLKNIESVVTGNDEGKDSDDNKSKEVSKKEDDKGTKEVIDSETDNTNSIRKQIDDASTTISDSYVRAMKASQFVASEKEKKELKLEEDKKKKTQKTSDTVKGLHEDEYYREIEENISKDEEAHELLNESAKKLAQKHMAEAKKTNESNKEKLDAGDMAFSRNQIESGMNDSYLKTQKNASTIQEKMSSAEESSKVIAENLAVASNETEEKHKYSTVENTSKSRKERADKWNSRNDSAVTLGNGTELKVKDGILDQGLTYSQGKLPKEQNKIEFPNGTVIEVKDGILDQGLTYSQGDLSQKLSDNDSILRKVNSGQMKVGEDISYTGLLNLAKQQGDFINSSGKTEYNDLLDGTISNLLGNVFKRFDGAYADGIINGKELDSFLADFKKVQENDNQFEGVMSLLEKYASTIDKNIGKKQNEDIVNEHDKFENTSYVEKTSASGKTTSKGELQNTLSEINNVFSSLNVGTSIKENIVKELNEALTGSNYEVSIGVNGELVYGEIKEVEDTVENAKPVMEIQTIMATSDGQDAVEGDATVKVTGDTKPLENDAKEKVSEVNSMVGTAKIDGDASLFDRVVESVRQKLASLKSEIQNVASQASNITVPNTGSGNKRGSSVVPKWTGTFGFYNGTMSAFANGSTGGRDVTVGSNQVALVNEVQQESIVHRGKWSLLQGGAHFRKLEKDDIIFNGQQTKELLKYGKIKSGGGRGKQIGAHANGTFGNHPISAFADGGYGAKVNNFGSTIGNSSAPSKSIAGTVAQAANSASQASQSASQASEKNEEVLDWIEAKISRIERTIENIARKAESTFNIWSDRAKALTDQIAKIREEINIQKQASDRYLKEANSVGLAEAYAKKVRDGLIDIEKITDDTLKENINKYKEYYEKYLESLDKQEELNEQIKELYQTAFENVASEYEEIIGGLQAQNDLIDAQITLIETRGHLVEEKSYADMIETENKILKQQEEELKRLENAFNTAINTGKIAKNSEAWYGMKSTIDEVRKAIVETNNQIVEYQNNIRQLKWDAFDKLRDTISDINDESEFIQDLLDAYELVNEKGDLTDNGFATLGLREVSYKNLMEQANAYKEEMLKISEELAKDPNNQTLIDRKKELVDAQRDAIKSAESEKESIKDLISDAYDKQLDNLQKLIDKYEEVIDKQKEEYNYAKDIKEQADEIVSLEKQISAYSGDNSEENMLRVQQLKEQLKDAKENLKDTQYDKYISETKDALDDLSEQFSDILNARLDDIDMLINEQIDVVSDGIDDIVKTIKEEADGVGYMISDALMVAVKKVNETEKIVPTEASRSSLKDYKGYASGTRRIPRSGNYFVNENGEEILVRKSDGAMLLPLTQEMSVLNHKATDNFWKIMNNPDQYFKGSGNTEHIGNVATTINNDMNVDLNITLPNVNNYEQFKTALKNDRTFEKFIQELTFGQLAGHGKYRKYNI